MLHKEIIMNTSAVITRLTQLIADTLGIEQTLLSYNASFSDDLGVDSLDLYELLTMVEKDFNISINQDEAEKITTVGALIKYVEAHTEESEPAIFMTLITHPDATGENFFTPLQHFKNELQANTTSKSDHFKIELVNKVENKKTCSG